MTAVNPFRPAEQVAPKVKCLIYGAPGVGKTYLALTAPGRIAVVDTEGGTAFYANRVGGRGGLHEFDVLPTKTFAQVEAALSFLRSNPGQYETLVIDPVTVLYETLQEAAQARRAQQRNDPDADIDMLGWQRIKRAYKRLMTDLVNIPIHVVCVARESELTEERGDRRVKIGWKPDAEKSTGYYFDTIVRLIPAKDGGRDAIVEKDRTGTHDLNARVPAPTFARLFAAAIKAGAKATGERILQSGEEAAKIDASLTMATAELEDKEEDLTPLGEIARTGTVARGQGRRSDLQARMTPDGWHVGFRLETGEGKHIPQVVAEHELGTRLYHEMDGDVTQLYGERVAVVGELYEVRAPARRMFHRLVLTAISGDGWALSEADGSALTTDDADLDAALDKAGGFTGNDPAVGGESGQPAKPEAATEPPMGEGADAPPDEPQSPTAAPVADSSDAALGSSTGSAATTPEPEPQRSDTQHRRAGEPIQAAPGPADSGSAPDLCGVDSPYGDGEHCELLRGHVGVHKVLSTPFPESWAAA